MTEPSEDELRVAIARTLIETRLWPGAWALANEVERNNLLFEADAILNLPALTARIEAKRARERRVVELEAALLDIYAVNDAGTQMALKGGDLMKAAAHLSDAFARHRQLVAALTPSTTPEGDQP